MATLVLDVLLSGLYAPLKYCSREGHNSHNLIPIGLAQLENQSQVIIKSIFKVELWSTNEVTGHQ